MYRPEIDGIRALSIVGVVACHLNLTWANLGYLGVDVFFVISGFLIIGGIIESLDARKPNVFSNLSLYDFYFRRARRILPVALLIQIIVLAYDLLFSNVLAFQSTLQDFKWSAIFLANTHFSRSDSDYFQIGFSQSPLMHTWSLSIEEQFYLLFPVAFGLIWYLTVRSISFIGWKASTHNIVLLILLPLISLSFMYNCYATEVNPISAYYSSAARFWEILFGGVLYVLCRKDSKYSNYRNQIYLIVAFLLSAISVLFLLDLISVLKQLSAVLLVSFFLIFQSHLSLISRALKNRVMTFLGKISYSLYLWHWPVILVIQDYSFSRERELVASIAVMFVLSILSWKYVETPFRKVQRPKLSLKGDRR
jgi:peptidoglycan/LPS O-acetylase OafA/YrhL